MKSGVKKKIPKFRNEEEERKFWGGHDSAEYLDYSKADKTIFPALKPTSHSISIRLPDYLWNRIKMIAHKKEIPCRSLVKVYLAERVEDEISRRR